MIQGSLVFLFNGMMICVLGLACMACESENADPDGGSTDTDADTDTDTDTDEMVMDDFGIGFPCETPVDLFEPSSPDYAVIKAVGRYNDCEVPAEKVWDGQGSLEEYVDDILWPMDYAAPDIGRHSSDMFPGYGHHLHITFFGSVQEVEPNHTEEHGGMLFINSDLLPDILAEDSNYLEPGTEYFFYHTIDETILDSSDNHTRRCISLINNEEIESRLFICHDGNTEYAMGERIQIAGLIHLEIMPENDLNCACYLNGSPAGSCDDFNTLVGE